MWAGRGFPKFTKGSSVVRCCQEFTWPNFRQWSATDKHSLKLNYLFHDTGKIRPVEFANHIIGILFQNTGLNPRANTPVSVFCKTNRFKQLCTRHSFGCCQNGIRLFFKARLVLSLFLILHSPWKTISSFQYQHSKYHTLYKFFISKQPLWNYKSLHLFELPPVYLGCFPEHKGRPWGQNDGFTGWNKSSFVS